MKAVAVFSEDWVGCWTSCRRVDSAMWPIPGLVLVKISRRRLANLVLHSVLTSSKTLAQRSGLSEEEITRQLSQILPGVVDKLTPQWPPADVGGAV